MTAAHKFGYSAQQELSSPWTSGDALSCLKTSVKPVPQERVLFLYWEPMALIGVFDSGVGGLTVLKELALAFPEENFIYLGDTARLPYGTKSPETIRKYSEQILGFLQTYQIDVGVIACSSASSQFLEKSWQGLPILNVIDPGAAAALKQSQGRRIGILGTRATVASLAYEKKIKNLCPEAQVFSQACPLFVPLAEEGWIDDPITNLIAFRYLQPLLAQQIDTLILGCTHYPLLKNSIQKACGSQVALVDPGAALCLELQELFDQKQFAVSHEKRSIRFLATDLSSHTRAWAEQILAPLPIENFEMVTL